MMRGTKPGGAHASPPYSAARSEGVQARRERRMKRTTLAELYASYYHWIAVAILLIAVQNSIELIGYGADSPAGESYETWIEIVGLAPFAVLFITAVTFSVRQTRLLWSVNGPADLKRRWTLRNDDFTVELLKRAALVACVVTGTGLGFIELTVDSLELPGDFIAKLGVMLIAGSFSLCFLAMSFFGGRGD